MARNLFKFIGLEEETMPSHYSLEDEEKIREERRLCFVGVCRAEDSLTLTWSRQLSGYAKGSSRFLKEMEIS